MTSTKNSFAKRIVGVGMVGMILAGFSARAAEAPVQPVMNGTFDKATGGRPDHWVNIGSWPFQVVEEEMSKFVRYNKPVEGHAQFITQEVPVPAGWRKLALMARLRVKDFGGANRGGVVQVYCHFLGADGKTIEGAGTPTIKVQGDTDGWQAFKSDPAAIPAGTAKIKVGTGFWNGTGTMDVDDIALVEGK